MSKKENRESFRLPLVADVVCRTEEGETYYGKLRDISNISLFMETAEHPPVGTDCELDIIMTGNHSRLLFDRLEGYVMRRNEKGVAIRLYERFEWIALVPSCFVKMRDRDEQ